MRGTAEGGEASPIRSDRCGWTELLSQDAVMGTRDRRVLDLSDGWNSRWWVKWKLAGADVHVPVRDLAASLAGGSRPVRTFTWSTRQRHRPGLAFLVSTGRHHGFESIAEQRVLLALDFAGRLVDVLAQPLSLRFTTQAGETVEHVPDFLAVTRDGVELIDVRPASRVKEADRIKFAAAAEAALANGWRYVVASGWRPNTVATIDALSSQRRLLQDPLGVQPMLEAAAKERSRPLAELVAGTPFPPIARAHLLYLLWHRRLGVDLSLPLTDRSAVWASDEERQS